MNYGHYDSYRLEGRSFLYCNSVNMKCVPSYILNVGFMKDYG